MSKFSTASNSGECTSNGTDGAATGKAEWCGVSVAPGNAENASSNCWVAKYDAVSPRCESAKWYAGVYVYSVGYSSY